MGPFSEADIRFAAHAHRVPPAAVRAMLREGDRDGLGFVQLIGLAASIGLQAYQQRQAKKAARRAEDEARKLEAQERAAAIAAQRRAQLVAQQQEQQRAAVLYQQKRAQAIAAAQLQAQVAATPPPAPAAAASPAISQMPSWAPLAIGAAGAAVLGIVLLRLR